MKILVFATPPSSDTPPGSADPKIREQFFEIKMLFASDKVIRADHPDPSLVEAFRDGDFLVLRSDAIVALDAAGCHDAANFWRMHSSVGRYFLFAKEVCRIVR